MADELLRSMLTRANSVSRPDERIEMLAQYGIALAQTGRIDECKELLVQMDVPRSTSKAASVVIQIMIFEGVLIYYDRRDERSLDRMIRAHALARAGRLVHLELQASVWLAHLAFNFDRSELLRTSIDFAIGNFESLEPSLQARICLIVADAAGILGLRESAYEWYALARVHAHRVQDRAMLTAIEYNRLAMGLSRARIEKNAGIADIDLGWREWLAELASLDRLHAGMGANALPELMLLAQSMLFQLDDRFVEAKSVLAGIAARSGGAARCGISEDLLELEMIACDVFANSDSVDFRDSQFWFKRIDTMALDEQFFAWPIFAAICSKLGMPFDSVRVSALQEAAGTHVQNILDGVQGAVGNALTCLSALQKLSGFRSKA